jgi:hypothetical protein
MTMMKRTMGSVVGVGVLGQRAQSGERAAPRPHDRWNTARRLIPWAVAAISSGCTPSMRARPAGQDCVVQDVRFVQASLGGGAWGPMKFGAWGSADTNGYRSEANYVACPAPAPIPPQLVSAWNQTASGLPNDDPYRTSHGFNSHPFRVDPLGGEETKTIDRVVYKYTPYRVYFHGCEFWMGTAKCSPPR